MPTHRPNAPKVARNLPTGRAEEARVPRAHPCATGGRSARFLKGGSAKGVRKRRGPSPKKDREEMR